MQTITALRRGVLSPYQSQRGEVPKTYVQLFKSDRGGLVFQPLPGLFRNVAVLDFISMYPSVMIEYNLSPETVGVDESDAWKIPELEVGVSPRLGLVPETLRPMRDKRVRLKRLLKKMNADDPRRGRYQAMSKALKWLSVVAYGRLGYANSTFGRINAHEAVTHIGRTVLLRAKAIAEDHGFTVLHLYVDSLFLCRADASQPEDFQPVIQAIEEETRLPLDLEGLYPWMAFLGRRDRPGVPVANRFFGLQPQGEHKIRGIALRREDTPLFVAETQLELLRLLAREPDPSCLANLLHEAVALLRSAFESLQNGRVPLEQLLVTQTLSRELGEYRVATPLRRATLQLQQAGKSLRMGQRVRYLHIRSGEGVLAWDLPDRPDPGSIETTHYKELLFRAAWEVLQPLGITEKLLHDWLFAQARYLPPHALQQARQSDRLDLPLFSSLQSLRVGVL
jgi:DNA polymerase-2